MSTDKGFQGWEHPCKACLGGGFQARKQTIDDGYGEVDQCEACGGDGMVEGDQKLLSYLWKHKHHTPFEMAGLTLEIQAPIFVVREWHRHRTQSYNELSGRYTYLPDLYYSPSIERLMAGKQASKNKQSSEQGFTELQAQEIQRQIDYATRASRDQYELLLGYGVARELARLVIPVNQYTRFRASANLRNWLGFLALRLDTSAQWEIRQYAEAVAALVKEKFPRTYDLFNEDQIKKGAC